MLNERHKIYIFSLHGTFYVSVVFKQMLRKINRRSKGKEGWDVIRTNIILERFSKKDSLSVDGIKYKLLDILGKGGYSCVYRGLSPDQNEVAVKVTNIINADRTVNERLLAEPGLMSRLGEVTEQAVVRVEAHQREGDMLVTVMERGEGTLRDVINNSEDGLSSSQVRHYWTSALHCVLQVHDQSVIHCDIKPENFVMVGGKLRLIDFGSSLVVPASEDDDDPDAWVEVTDIAGTNGFLPPECFDSVHEKDKEGKSRFVTRLSRKVDIWSLGMLLARMTRAPASGSEISIDTPLQVIISQVSPSHLASLPALRDVLELCLKRKPALRPTASKLIEIDKQM